jgi:uncharacterized membrane protein
VIQGCWVVTGNFKILYGEGIGLIGIVYLSVTLKFNRAGDFDAVPFAMVTTRLNEIVRTVSGMGEKKEIPLP